MIQKVFVSCLMVLSLCTFGSTSILAETSIIVWTQKTETNISCTGFGVSVDAIGNAYVTGAVSGSFEGCVNAGGYDIFLHKYDTTGVRLWARQLGTEDFDFGNDVAVDAKGNAFVTGYTRNSLDGNISAGGHDMFLAKYNTDGIKLWTRQLGTMNIDIGCGVSVDGDGNAYVTGYTDEGIDGNDSMGGSDIFLTKYAPDGTKMWTLQDGTARYDEGRGVSVDAYGNVYITGIISGRRVTNDTAGYGDVFLTKVNKDGVKLWTRELSTAYGDLGYGVSVDANGNAYVTGFTAGSLDENISAGLSDMFLAKYDTNGVKLWTRQMGTAGRDYGFDVSVDFNGNVFVAGQNGPGSLSQPGDMFLTKFDTEGSMLWTRQWYMYDIGAGYGVSVDNGGNAYVTGHPGYNDIILVKIASIPEPDAIFLVLCGLASLLFWRRRPVYSPAC